MVVGIGHEQLPRTFALGQNHPNPFNPNTAIRYDVAQAGHVRLTIYNVRGQVVRSLVNEPRSRGRYTELWDGLGDRGEPMASGVYFYRLTAGAFEQTRKMVLLK